MQMFENCTSLTSAASLVHVRRMASESCSEMYKGCSALVAAADLDIYSDGDAVKNLLAPSCFAGMYENCTSITNFYIPGICCAEQCYERMFKGCTALVSVGGWVRDPLFYSAREMFRGCTSLRSCPELHQQALAKGCYAYMFADCTSLIALPDLPEVLLEESCYEAMFMNCSNLIVNLEGPGVKWGLPNYRCSGDFDHSPVHIMLYGTGGDFTGEPARDTVYYVYSALPFVTVTPQDVPNTTKRVFVYRTQAEEYEELELADGSCTVRRDEQVKVTYTVIDGYWTYPDEATSYDAVFTASIEGDNPVPENILLAPTPTPPCAECLAFTSANTFTLAQTGSANLEWSTNRITWATLGKTVVRAEASGESSFAAYVRGTGNSALGTTFVLDGTAIACSGNAETLLDRKQVAAGQHPPMYYSAFENLFAGCTALTTAPELPSTELVFDCYRGMFSGCTSLVAAPALPARKVSRYCYREMFKNCTSLVAAPELPAENTEVECYREMFAGCSSLKAAPALPVDGIVSPLAYYGMFRDCTSLTDATELPALEVRDGGYAYMFSGCTALTNAPSTLPATLIGNYVQGEHVGSYAGMFQNCSSLVEPPARIEKESDKSFIMMFQGCTSLVHTPAMPQGIGSYAADRMFQNCTSITGGCENIRVSGKFSCRQMFENCTSLKTAPSVYVLSSGGESVCESMFSGCTSLKTANITFHDYLYVGKDNAFHAMFKGCVALTKPVGRIPMWSLGKSCCESMYEGCVSIEDVTTIAATEFGQDCCRNMFKGCTGVFLHAVQGNAKAWSIGSGASCGSDWNADMFAGTSGSIATVVGAPVPGVVYGLATELTIVPPTVSNATYRVCCNGVETDKAKPGDPCLVVYTGEGDYRFSPATNEWGTVVTAAYAESGVISFDVPEVYLSYQYLVPTFSASGAFVGCLRKYTPPTVVLTGKRTDTVSLDGWYVVSNACELTKGATVDGVVNLVLLDGSTLKAKAADADAAAIDVGARAGSSLTIFAQSEDPDSMGALTTTATAGAGIGGGRDETGLLTLSPVTISGGRVTATSQSGAGIGGGAGAAGVGIDVNGGLVTATSQTGAGIGGGTNGCGRVITVRGGTVVATGSSGGADIGGGQGAAAPDSDISILGGSVWASTIGRAPVNAQSQAVYPVVITNVTASPADVKGLDGYGVNGLYPVDGQLCLYLPNGAYAFWADDDFHRLVVAEGKPKDSVNPPLDPLASYGSADAALEQLGLAVLAPPAAADVVVPVRQYDEMFDKTVVAGSAPGTFEIAFTLKEDVQAEVEDALNEEEVLSELAETVTSEEPSVTVRTKPGLYYGMVGATDPTGLQEATVPAGGWVLGTGAEMKIMGEKPAGATNRSFYQLRAVASPE